MTAHETPPHTGFIGVHDKPKKGLFPSDGWQAEVCPLPKVGLLSSAGRVFPTPPALHVPGLFPSFAQALAPLTGLGAAKLASVQRSE